MSPWKITKNEAELLETKLMRKDSYLCVFEKFYSHQFKEKIGLPLDSSEFTSGEKSEYRWIVRLYPNGHTIYTNCIVVQLNCLNEEFKNQIPNGVYSLSILNEKNYKTRKFLYEGYNFYNCPDDTIMMRIPKQIFQSLLVNGNLRVLVEITTIVDDNPSAVSPATNNLLKFLENEKFTDVILEFNGTELKTHKILLSLKSPVFSTMFENETMKEAQENRVVIEDIDAEVGRQMLEFIYTDQEPSRLNELTAELLIAADKYEIEELKKMCEKKLMKDINLDNAISVLCFSNMYNAESLKKSTIQFIGAHGGLLKSVGFQNLERNDTQLAMDVYRHLLMENLKI